MKKFLFFLFSLWTMQVGAHPHAFIELKTKPLIENNQLVGFSTKWTLDEASSSELLYELQLIGTNQTARKELTEELYKNVVAEHYFSYLYDKQGNKVKFKSRPQHYGLKEVGSRLQYYFDFMLSQPSPLTDSELTLMIYDKTYYVAMYYQITDKTAVDFTALPSQCQGKVLEPNVSSKLQQYASSLDKTQRDEDDTLGQMFAQKIQILCQ